MCTVTYFSSEERTTLEPSLGAQEVKATIPLDSEDNNIVVLRLSEYLKAHSKLTE